MTRKPILALALFSIAIASQAHATAPTQFSVQGVLRDNTGKLQSLAVSGLVKLWSAASGGTQIGANYPFNGVGVSNGLFTVTVSDAGLVAALAIQPSVFVELTVTGMGGAFPRQPVSSELFAIEAATADSLSCNGCVGDGNVAAAGISGSKVNSAVALATTSTSTQQLQGVNVSGNAPANGQVLEFNTATMKWTPTSLAAGGVTSVTASAPLMSSGGVTPNISLANPLPVANGGTGSMTQNFVDLTNNQFVGGLKTFTNTIQVSGAASGSDGIVATSGGGSGDAGRFNGNVDVVGTTTLVAAGASAPSLNVSGPQQATPGAAAYFTGAPSTAINAMGGIGISAQGGTSSNFNPGPGIATLGGSVPSGTTFFRGGDGLQATGGDASNNRGGNGIVATAGFGANGWGDAIVGSAGGRAVGSGSAGLFNGRVTISDSYIDFGTLGVSSPSASSVGWKIMLFNDNSTAHSQYGFGIAGGELWYSTAGIHRWYSNSPSPYTTEMKLDGSGNLTIRGTYFAGGVPDLAETIAAAPDVGAADVVCVDPKRAAHVVRCRRDDRAVLGVISDGSSAILINSHAGSVDSKLTGQPLVLAGRVPVKVSLENGPIEIGDFLGPSSTPGVAMKLTEPGMGVGVALDSFDGKRGKSGTVLCFVKVGEHNLGGELKRLQAENAQLRSEAAALRLRLDKIESAMVALARGRDKWALRGSIR